MVTGPRTNYSTMPYITGVILASCLLAITIGLAASIELASYYNDHMVLQMAPMRATIWGYAEKSAQICVTLDGKKYRTVSSNVDGRWMIAFDPIPAGGPYTISIESEEDEDDAIQLDDVLFGDVWICSGQSNMALNVPSAINGTEELSRSYQYPRIRLFAVNRDESNVPLDDIDSAALRWSLPTPDTLGQKVTSYEYFSAVCWFYGKDLYDHFQHPIGLIASNWGGTPVEAWSSQDALEECQEENREKRAFRDETVLWNGMIHPLRRMVIKGAIWYQGERNTAAPDTYNCTFPAMIDDWREKWYQGTGGLTDKKFPFGFVQICTSNAVEPGLIGNYPILRWHQTADFGYAPNDRMQNVFMAVSIDLPDPDSPFDPIHPRYKQDVGKRLALASRAVAYGEDDVVFAGPFPTNIRTTDGELTIEFDNGTANINIVNNDGFEVCCSETFELCNDIDGRWSPAIVEKMLTPSIVKFSHTCEGNITQVRYLWREYPCTFKACSIYSVENELPTPPFIYNVYPYFAISNQVNSGNSQIIKDQLLINICMILSIILRFLR